MKIRPALLPWILALVGAVAFGQDEGKDQPALPSEVLLREEQPWSRTDVTAAEVKALLGEAETWLGQVAKEASDAPLRAPLEQAAALLQELVSLLDRPSSRRSASSSSMGSAFATAPG